MKTQLYVERGVELDWDNENHRRLIEEEAFAESYRHPKPTMAPPERSPWWWLWRALGFFVYMPLRKSLMRYLARHWVGSVYGELARPGYWRYDWLGAQTIKEWIERGPRCGPRGSRLRRALHWLTEVNVYNQCSWCGFTEYHDEFTVHEHPDDEGRTINMFEHVEGGGTDYWGEGQDAYGWMWCYRCGAVEWESA